MIIAVNNLSIVSEMQGFLLTEASVLEVEVWGFGGKSAKQQQDLFKKRETLFTEQRRKVEYLKYFYNVIRILH